MTAGSLLQGIEILAVFAAAVSGILEARRKRMDLVGVYAVALITAFGGGTLRDLLLDRRPLYWIQNDQYVVWVLGLCVLVLYFTRSLALPQAVIDIPDALGLGLFTITGAYYALDQGMTLFLASLFGVITGVFGGVLRDVVCNEIPVVFGQNTSLYATCSFAGAWAYLLALRGGAAPFAATMSGIAVTFCLRMLAIRYHLTLPAPLEDRRTPTPPDGDGA